MRLRHIHDTHNNRMPDYAATYHETYNALSGMPLQPLPERSTSVKVRLHAARQKPLNTLSTAEVRLLINRHEPKELPLLPNLLALALDILDKEPLLHADYYPGDLLYTVLKLPTEFWHANPDLHQRLTALVQRERASLTKLLQGSMKRDLPEMADAFLAAHQN